MERENVLEHRKTIKETRARIIKKNISHEEVVSEFLSRIKEKNGETNALLTVFDRVSQEMKEKDEKLPLYGAIFAIKDNILIKGERCTAASKILEHYVAPFDATVIKKIREKGGVFIGKGNLDEFAMGSSTENSAFGFTRNPLDKERVPGGSSGGPAAAVAEGMCNAGLGSDTGGSIRQPAAFCGIVGFKPTYGTVSRNGVISMASSFDQVGPFANCVEDAETIFNAISGKDFYDSVTSDIIKKEVKENIKVGVPKEYFVEGMEKEVKEGIEEAIKKLEDAGTEVVEISLPHTEYALPAYEIIMASEVSANLARYDGMRYGLEFDRPAAKKLQDAYLKNRGEGFGKEVKRRIILGTYALSAGYYDAYYVKAQRVRQLIAEDFKKAFSKVDVILAPTTPTLPFKIGEKIEDPLAMHLSDIFTVTANLAGLPSLCLPCAKKGGFYIGAQVLTKRFYEEVLFSTAKKFEKIWEI
jgi:aspartyl-tRNA(Asn)/glutamyl-tRNA(Gln) amidotransferase subunit A